MRFLKLGFLVICFLVSSSTFAQNVILNIDDGLNVPGDCQTITAGDEITFERGLGMFQCNPDVIILLNGNPIPVFTSSDLIFTFPFSEPGEYIIFCGANDVSASPEVATSAACYTVLSGIPTMGEWGIIVLTLMLLISSVVALQGRELKRQTLFVQAEI